MAPEEGRREEHPKEAIGSPLRRANRCGVVEDIPARAPRGELGWSGRAAQGVAESAATTVVAPRKSSQSPRDVRPIRTTAWSHDGQRRIAPSSMA
jgi:hypothetical protein